MRDPFGKLICFIGGAALVAIFGTLGVDAWRDYRAFGDSPTRSTLPAAVVASTNGRRWVSLEGAPWRCAQLVSNIPGGVAFLPASAEDGSTVVARFDHPIPCDAVIAQPLIGIIEVMTREREADLRAAGLALRDGAQLRTLSVCAFCGKGNSRLGVIMCALFVLLGLSLYPLRRAYLSLRGRTAAALHTAIHAPPAGAAHADRVVRVLGGAVLVCGAVGFSVGEGWVAYGVVPVRWIGAVGVMLGAWMVAFPAQYRKLAARAKER